MTIDSYYGQVRKSLKNNAGSIDWIYSKTFVNEK